MKDFKQNRIALVYDFDKTLTPLAMQEYTVLRELGIEGDEFWREVGEETTSNNADRMLVWMRLMIEKIEEKKKHIDAKRLSDLAEQIEYFPGVETWFDRVNNYIQSRAGGDVQVDHYLISAGLKEIIEGTSIRSHFRQVYASAYHYNHHGAATFPSVLVNDTMKTQFLFRINKGRELLSESINDHMPESERPVPFSRMIYLGDGMSDVPAMATTKKSGGYALAVWSAGDEAEKAKSLRNCEGLLDAGRIDFYAEADYREGSKLESFVFNLLDIIISRVEYDRRVFDLSVEGKG